MPEPRPALLDELEARFGGDPKPADYHRVARALRAPEVAAHLHPLRVAFLASFTLEFVEPFLVVEAARLGLALECCFGPFGQFEQPLADPGSALHRFAPEAVVLALRPEDVDPDASVRLHAEGGAERLEQGVAEAVERLVGCVRQLRERSQATALVANFAEPAGGFGLLAANVAPSPAAVCARAGESLRDELSRLPGAFVFDYAGLVRDSGLAGWTDPRLWALGRIAVAAAHQPRLARHLARSLAASLREPAKCLVLDLDNTLWGGVVGEDGPEGIALGDDHPGSVFKEFQRAVLALKDQGVLLAVASKNNPEDVAWVFEHHPEMLLRWDDLAAARVNWSPKSANLREIAAELNLGADALVFFDDNPVERAEVRANVPEVQVVEVPADPLGYRRALRDIAAFDRASLSAEDRARTRLYAAERRRSAERHRSESLEEFLAGLEMVAEIGRVGPATLARVAQLVGKTNQFNLTTRRHSRAVLEAMAGDPARALCWLRLRDRHGDLGLVAVGALVVEGDAAVLDLFLMSCRVMGRHAERALLSHLAGEARALGCGRLLGEYIPTRKNAVVKSFYEEAGFARASGEGEAQRFALELDADALPWPAVIARAADTSPTSAE